MDWSKLTYQQLLDAVKQQNPGMANGYQAIALNNDNGTDPNNAKIDLSGIGLPGNWSATNTRDQGTVFAGEDPNSPGKFVALRAGDHPGIDSSRVGGSFGGQGGLNVTGVSKGDTLLDKMIPLIVAGGTGMVGLNALGLLGAGAAGATGAGAAGETAGSLAANPSSWLSAVGGEAAAPVAVGDLGLGSIATIPTAGAAGGLGGAVAFGGAGGSAGAGGYGSWLSAVPGEAAAPVASGSLSGLATAGNAAGATSGLSGYLGMAQDALGSPLGKLGTSLLGSFIGSQPNTQSATSTKSVDPRIAPYIYGPSGVLANAANLYAQNPSGINDAMRQGWQKQLDVLNNPATQAGFQNMQNVGSGLLNTQIAGNPYSSGQAKLPSIPTQFRSLLGG